LKTTQRVAYFSHRPFKPHAEHAINPLDADIGLRFALNHGELLLSEKDSSAPSFSEAQATGLLPQWEG